MEFADWYRAVLVITTTVVVLVMIVQAALAFRRLSIGQKLFVTGSIFMLFYVTAAAAEAVQQEIGYRHRLIFWTLGLVAYFAYLLEPWPRKSSRFGKDLSRGDQ